MQHKLTLDLDGFIVFQMVVHICRLRAFEISKQDTFCCFVVVGMNGLNSIDCRGSSRVLCNGEGGNRDILPTLYECSLSQLQGHNGPVLGVASRCINE